MILITLLAIVLAVSTTTGQNEFNYLCGERQLDNGAGFNSHPYDCTKYIQCEKDIYNNVIARVRPCGFGTFFSKSILNCASAGQTVCENDLCASEMNGKQRKAEGNCRGYYECLNGKSVPKCCPSGQKHDIIKGCIANENGECTDDCYNSKYVTEAPLPSNETEFNSTSGETTVTTTTEAAPAFECDRRPVFGHPERFLWILYDGAIVNTMSCPAGTVFLPQTCNCGHMEVKDSVKKCEPEVLLTFSKDHRDVSVHHNHVVNDGVVVENGVAKFNGNGSRLIIPRFTNVEISSTFIIKMKYKSNHNVIPAGMQRALFSNNGCKVEPSLISTEDREYVHAAVGTYENFRLATNVYQAPLNAGQEKEFVYKFHNEKLRVSLGNTTTEIPANGHLRNVQCALHIGYADGVLSFEGEIDEIAIYLCNPEI
ncbi:protein PIF-like [Mya arenaria]|uniref:protein PIF-like n=1 Tax=Mya arenaria TaxID=6604 RepID=UPI0022E560DB|nr:protein PIF-like [Mya arenaria]